MAMAASEINRHSLSGKSPHEILPLEERKCPFCGKGHREGLEVRKWVLWVGALVYICVPLGVSLLLLVLQQYRSSRPRGRRLCKIPL